ncbi:MAG: restriction endonuclease subunit S, partial [Bacteroidota bacterium]
AEYFQPKYVNLIQYLVNNWRTITLSEVGQVTSGKTPSYTNAGVGVIRSGDLSDITDLSDLKYAHPDQNLFYLESGDVCISSIGFGSIGKVQVFDLEERFATVSEVTVIRQDVLNPYYLQVFLQSRAGQLQIERQIVGATGQLHLYPSHVEKIVIPILPDEVQLEIESLIKTSRQAKLNAEGVLQDAVTRVEQLIMGSE